MLHSHGIRQMVDGGRHLVNSTGKHSPMEWKENETPIGYKELNKIYLINLFRDYYFM